MSPRAILVALIVLATTGFVVGTVIERNSSDESGHHEGVTGMPSGENGGETPTEHAGEGRAAESPHGEFRPLGIDVEAWPFVALATVASLGLALAAWLRPDAAPLLACVAVALLAFAVLDVREVVHQADIDKTGLAVLAGLVAALHAAAAVVAATMAMRARQPHTRPPGNADTLPA